MCIADYRFLNREFVQYYPHQTSDTGYHVGIGAYTVPLPFSEYAGETYIFVYDARVVGGWIFGLATNYVVSVDGAFYTLTGTQGEITVDGITYPPRINLTRAAQEHLEGAKLYVVSTT